MTKKTQFSVLLLLALGLFSFQINAQDNSSPAADGPVIPADKFDRGTPRRSVDGFLAVGDTSDYETAAEYLDLRNLRGEAAMRRVSLKASPTATRWTKAPNTTSSSPTWTI